MPSPSNPELTPPPPSTQPTLVLAGAIIVAGGLIGLGLWAGLRERAAPQPAPPALTTSAPINTTTTSSSSVAVGVSALAPASVPAPPPSTTAPLVSSATRSKAERDLRAAAEEFRTKWIKAKCWDPIVAKTPEPKISTYHLSLSVDANGNEVAHGLGEVRDKPSRQDVAACARNLQWRASVPAPGEPLTIEFDLELP
ncbi:MAG: hypothetical protein U0271_03345 [Polyangiaceae bacterium]